METIISLVTTLLGVWFGLLIIPLWFIAISIILIKQISDDPDRPKKPYFYTAIEPGRIKAVLRGGRVIKYLMNYPGYRFPWHRDKSLNVTRDETWEVTPDEPDDETLEEKQQEFEFLVYLFWFTPWTFIKCFHWCTGVVYRATGHKFVGFWPFQVLHLYRFTRRVQKLDDHGRPITNEQGLPILVDSSEMTDHVRARTFVRQSSGQETETQEGLKVKVVWVADVHTTNPQKALFGSDRWDIVLDSTVIRTLASTTRTMPINQILTATAGTKDKLAEKVLKETKTKLKLVGLELDTFNIVDFEANLSEEDQKALTAKWRAERHKEALKIEGEGRGEGRAAEITRVAQAIKDSGEEAKRAQELEAQIATAKAVGEGGGVAIIGAQDGTGGTQAAILAELRKLNKEKGK